MQEGEEEQNTEKERDGEVPQDPKPGDCFTLQLCTAIKSLFLF